MGIWPNWRVKQYRRWDFESENCRPCLPDLAPRLDCGTYQEHLAHEELKRKLASYLENIKAEQARTAQFLANREATYLVDSTPNGASGAFGALLDGMVRQARNISDNMGISPMWDREPSRPSWAQNGEERVWWDRNLGSLRSSSPPNTTWHAQYPEQVWNERSEPQWTVTSTAPRPFEGRTYRFDPISFTVPLPAEPPPSSSSLAQPSLDALPRQPAPDSEA